MSFTPDWRLDILISVAAGTCLLAAAGAVAQTQCSVLSEPNLLLSFSDSSPPGSITPRSMRNFVCSVFPSTGSGITIVNNTIELAPIPADTVSANITGTSAIPVGSSLTFILDALLGSTQGDTVFRGATTWSASILEHTLGYSVPSPSVVQNGTYPLQIVGVSSAEIDSLVAWTGGSGSPGFTLAANAGGSGVTGCTALSVTSTTPVTASCTASVTAGEQINLIVTNSTGTPTPVLMQLNWHPLVP